MIRLFGFHHAKTAATRTYSLITLHDPDLSSFNTTRTPFSLPTTLHLVFVLLHLITMNSDDDRPFTKAGANDWVDEQEENQQEEIHENDPRWTLFNNPRETLPAEPQWPIEEEETEIRMDKNLRPGQNPPLVNLQNQATDNVMGAGREDEDEIDDFTVYMNEYEDEDEGEDEGEDQDQDVDMTGGDETGRNEAGGAMKIEEPNSTAANNGTKRPRRRSNGINPNAIIDEESTARTRGQRNKQITWCQDNKCSSVARAPVYRVGAVHGEPSKSPHAPIIDMTASAADGSLYVKLSWAAVRNMFSHWIEGDEATHTKLQQVLHLNPKLHWPKKPSFAKDKSVWVPLAFLHALADQGAPWVPVAK